MTNETQTSSIECSVQFGTRLQSAREALGLSTKDAAARLRLNEKVILMMEKGQCSQDIPLTFIRGYLRSYAKLLQISEQEIKKALETVKPKSAAPTTDESTINKTSKPATPVTSGNYFMQASTYAIMLTMVGLVGAWWYSHNTPSDSMVPSNPTVAENQLLPLPGDNAQPNLGTGSPLALADNTAAATPASSVPAPTLPTTQTTPPSITMDKSTDDTTIVEHPAPAATKSQKTAPVNDDDDEDDADDNETD